MILRLTIDNSVVFCRMHGRTAAALPVRILLIKLKHIGDSLLLTAATGAIRQQYPDAEISVLVRSGCEGILSGAESIDHIYTSVAPEASRRNWFSHLSEFKTIHQLRRQRFDIILELTRGDRGRWWMLALRSRSKATYQMKSCKAFWSLFFDRLVPAPSPHIHAVKQDFELVRQAVKLEAEQPPALEFSRQRADVSRSVPEGAVVIHPATRWRRKQWPEVNWKELIKTLIESGETVVLSSGPDPDEVELCDRLADGFNRKRLILTKGEWSWAELAGALYRSKIFIGVDTAAMHLAAACGTPTVGLFLPWIAPMWHPWNVKHEAVFAAGFPTHATAELNDLSKAVAAMEGIQPEQVLNAMDRLLEA